MRGPVLRSLLLTAASCGCMVAMQPVAQAQQASATQKELDDMRRLLQQQQQTIDDLQRRMQEMQGQQSTMRTDFDKAKDTIQQRPLITSSSAKLQVNLSGQIDRLLNFADDGKSTKAYFVDNNISVSRLRLTATGQVTDDFSVGSNIELAVSPNNSSNVTQVNEEGQDTFNVRKAEAIFLDKRYGTVSFGKGDPATKDIARLDLSGTDVLAYAMTGDPAGGLFFRTDDGEDLTGVQIKNVFTDFDSSRQDRIRYDTPTYYGAFASASASANQRWGVAARWAGAGYGLKATAGVGVQNANATVSGFNVNNVYAGSASVLHDDTGLSLTYAAGWQDQDDGTGQLQYIKLGWQHGFFEFGKTAFSVDFGYNKDTPVDGDTGKTIGVVALQNLENIWHAVLRRVPRLRSRPGRWAEHQDDLRRHRRHPDQVLMRPLSSLILAALLFLLPAVASSPCPSPTRAASSRGQDCSAARRASSRYPSPAPDQGVGHRHVLRSCDRLSPK